MKTLLFTLEYPPFYGGVANYYGNLVKYWPAAGEISVLDNSHGRLINDKFPFLKWLPAYFALRKIIKQKKTDHILVGQILPLGTVALINAKLNRTKYSVILHGMDLAFALKRPRKKWLAGIILKNSEKIICGNGYLAGLVSQALPTLEQKIVIVNPGIDPVLSSQTERSGAGDPLNLPSFKDKGFLPPVKMTNNKIILLSVGRLVKRKGFDKVIECLPEILKQAPNLIYVILGDGEEFENCNLKIKNLGLEKQVQIIKQAPDSERDSWYNACDIFIMPARNIGGDFEGFGIVYLEANLAGKPVIAGRSGGAPDAVIDGFNGLLVNPEDANEISEAIVKLALNPGLRRKLGEQGRARAINEFNWEKQIHKIYKAII